MLKRPLVFLLMHRLNKSKNIVYEYLKHCIVEQRDSDEKCYYIFLANALKNHFLRAAIASSYKGKSGGTSEFVELIDMIILSDKKIGKKASPEQAFNLFQRYLKPTSRYAEMDTVCLKTYYTYVKLGITQVNLMDLPEIVSRKTAVKRTLPVVSTRGTSIHSLTEVNLDIGKVTVLLACKMDNTKCSLQWWSERLDMLLHRLSEANK
jgi:hypothetical protein